MQINHLVAQDEFITGLRCEWNMRHTYGIQTTRPQFNWFFQGEEPAVKIAMSELRIAETAADLDAGKSLWSKRGEDLFSCRYDGNVLRPGTRYYWRVRLLDADGKPVAVRGSGADGWSRRTGVFAIGLQQPADWEGAQWVGELSHDVEWADFDYQTKFTLVSEAYGVYFRAHGNPVTGYMWQINTILGPEPLLRPHVFENGNCIRMLPPVKLNAFFPQGIDWGKEHTLRISARGTLLRTYFDDVLVHEVNDGTFKAGSIGLRTSTREEALVHELSVKDVDGNTLLHDAFRGHIMMAFHNPPLDGDRLRLKSCEIMHTSIIPKNAPRMRKTFALAGKPIRSAIATVCGFGFYELWLNGRKADPERVMAPGWCGSRSLFDTYDVTELMRAGSANTVGLWLAAGYSDDFSRYAPHWLRSKRAILHLAVTYEDGTRQAVVTDKLWEITQDSPITRASIYAGESYDANLEDAAWCLPAGSRSAWQPVTVFPDSEQPRLLSNDEPPIRMRDEQHAVKITQTKPGVYVAHFAQNRAGVLKIHVKGPKGTTIRLHTSELLDRDGNIDPWTNREASSTDEFTLAGTGDVETYVPRFTYHGFQFVEITGWPGVPQPEDIVSVAVCADVEDAGDFACSHSGLSQYMNAARWSMLSNFMSYPTDCDMRNERTPCMMDSQAYEDAALQYFNLGRYYAKWLEDGRRSYGNPDWNGDMATLPWRLYMNYGDERFLAVFYDDNIKAQVDRHVAAHPGLVWPKQGYGDWCAPNDGSWNSYFHDVEVVNSTIFHDMLRIAADSAEILGREDAANYRKLQAASREAFHKTFYHADRHGYGDGSQTTAVMPLAFGIVPQDCREAVATQLVKTIREDNHSKANVGIYGSRYLGDVLCDIGESDLWVHMMTQPEYPGFGFMFANGATTLWEQWTFKGGMNSHNHAMYSGASHTLMTRLAGIRAVAAGYGKVEIRPCFPKSLEWVRAFRETPRGRIDVSWRRIADGKIDMEVNLPPYQPAVLSLPNGGTLELHSGRNQMTLDM